MSYFKRLFPSSETGVTLILVLMLVAGVGLLVVPVMLLTASGLRATNLSEQRFMERYAVDAGIEDALWRIRYDPSSVVDGIPYFTGQDFGQTFNGLDPEVTITLAAPPPPPADPTEPRTAVSGWNFEGYKIINSNWVEPCLTPGTCVSPFIYTLYFENFSSNSAVDIDQGGFGDCLPPGFEFVGVVPDGVFGIRGQGNSWDGIPLTHLDLLPLSVPPPGPQPDPYEPGVAYPRNEVGDLNKNPGVYLTVDQNDSDSAHPCAAVDGEPRWQVQWNFDPPLPQIPPNTLAYVKIEVTTDGLDPGIYYNELWWETNSKGQAIQEVKFTCGTSPVYSRFAEWDITSSAGGTEVNVRATIRKDLADEPLAILSWQVGDGTSIDPPPGSMHIGRLCGRSVPANGTNWEAEVAVTVHGDNNHNSVPDATVEGAWSLWDGTSWSSGGADSCTTDAAGKCLVDSGSLSDTILSAKFTPDKPPPAPFLSEFDHMNFFLLDRPQP